MPLIIQHFELCKPSRINSLYMNSPLDKNYQDNERTKAVALMIKF